MTDDRIANLDKAVKSTHLPSVTSALLDQHVRHPLSAGAHRNFSQHMAAVALHKFVVEDDLAAAKQQFYLSGLSRLRMYAEFRSGAESAFSLGVQMTLASLFSDAAHLHPVWASLRHPDGDRLTGDDLLGYRMFRLYQAGLIQDWAVVAEIAAQLRRDGHGQQEWVAQRLAYFDALCSGDTGKVAAALQVLLDPRCVERDNAHFKNFPLGKFMCAPAMWYAKLAWICGHEIEIDHPLIVSALLPVKPLPRYDNPHAFLIDPVLDNKPITVFGELPAEVVERRNRVLYGNEAMIDVAAGADAVPTRIEIASGVTFSFANIAQWTWEFHANKFVARTQSGTLKVIVALYPVKPQSNRYGFVTAALEKLCQALDQVHNRTGHTLEDGIHFMAGVEYKDRQAVGGLYHFQVAKFIQAADKPLLASLLFQYTDENERYKVARLAKGVTL